MVSSRRIGTNLDESSYNSGGGADYSSLSTFESDVDVDTTATGNSTTYVLNIESGSHTESNITFNGGTHDATFPLIIRANSGDENRGIRDQGARFNLSADAHMIIAYDDFIYFQDLGFTGSINGTSTRTCLITGYSSDHHFIGCHIWELDNTGSGLINGIAAGTSSGDVYIVNCILSDVEHQAINTSSGQSVYVYNTTIDGAAYGLDGGSGSVRAKNCSVTNSSNTNYFSTYHADSTDNASGSTDAPGSNPENSVTPTFVSSTDFHLQSGDTDLKDLGTDLSSDSDFDFDDDIDSDTRSGSWDIGADEFVAAGGGLSMPVAMHNYRRRRTA